MGYTISDSGGGSNFSPPPEGTHAAVCNMLVNLGMQETDYQGQKRIVEKVYIGWELPDHTIEYTDKDGVEQKGPMVIGKTYTASTHEKSALGKDLSTWRGRAFTDEERKAFDLRNILGKACQVTIVHKLVGEKTYANVNGVSGWQKRMGDPPAPERPIIKYSPVDDEADWDRLPEWLRKKVMARIVPGAEAAHLNQPDDPGHQGYAGLDDEIPF